MQNLGEIYSNLKQYQKAEDVLNEAFTKAHNKNLNYTMAGIDLTLTNVYLSQNKFAAAEKTLKNGLLYAKTMQNRDLENDYNYAFFQLEYKRKNYQSALAGLLFALVFLLIIDVKKTNKSNIELTRLHTELSHQKEDLDRFNRYLEDIIDERTKDLKEKNKGLSDYSSQLSHQIRGPIVTLKGIVYLQQNDLIDKDECIQLIEKCVFDIDEEIVSISNQLNENRNTS